MGDRNKLPVLEVLTQALSFSFRRLFIVIWYGILGMALGALIVLGTTKLVTPEFFEPDNPDQLDDAGGTPSTPAAEEAPVGESETPPATDETIEVSPPDTSQEEITSATGSAQEEPSEDNPLTEEIDGNAGPAIRDSLTEVPEEVFDPELLYIVFAFYLSFTIFSGMISAPVMRRISVDERLPFIPVGRPLLNYLLSWVFLVFLYFFFTILVLVGVLALLLVMSLLALPEPAMIVTAYIALLVGFFYFQIRLSLLQVDVIAESSFDSIRSWQITRGNVLRLLLLFILISLIGGIANLLLDGGTEVVAYFIPDKAFDPDPTLSLFKYFLAAFMASPATQIIFGLLLVVSAWSTCLQAAAAAYAWRALKGVSEKEDAS